jgi:hypothetical protein
MDVVTGGKFLLGVGLGYRPEEYEMYGVAMSERASRLAEEWRPRCVTRSSDHSRLMISTPRRTAAA